MERVREPRKHITHHTMYRAATMEYIHHGQLCTKEELTTYLLVLYVVRQNCALGVAFPRELISSLAVADCLHCKITGGADAMPTNQTYLHLLSVCEAQDPTIWACGLTLLPGEKLSLLGEKVLPM